MVELPCFLTVLELELELKLELILERATPDWELQGLTLVTSTSITRQALAPVQSYWRKMIRIQYHCQI